MAGVAGVKDAWPPFNQLLQLMSANQWMFPLLWSLTIVAHWLLVGIEIEQQRKRLEAAKGQKRAKRR